MTIDIDKFSLKHWAKLILRSKYRDYCQIEAALKKLHNSPRYTPLVTSVLGKPVKLIDGRSFYYSYKEIYEEEIYKFLTDNKKPVIIDCGSNIGLSILYFKSIYPDSDIIAFEPDPIAYKTLEANLKSFGYEDVEIYNKALWKEETTLEFGVEGADGGRIMQNKQESFKGQVKVPAVCLSNYLSQPVDFLKLDIEGAETAVLKECSDYLHQVKNLFVEYHSFWGQSQTINEILSILKDANFRVSIHSQFASGQPFVKQPLQLGMDLQLNIFAYRILESDESSTN
ncbi:MAG: FkbM family methyltransferase [Cyanobacteria bacterium]|jgi:FkbM family methyltransferase|nr:FkbM family methyltransferase [Cyanobacteria bacterium GSL.Bin1]